jgi:RHS repeat-associated protein
MVALAEKFSREANSSRTRTSQNRYGARNPSPTVSLQPKNRGPARKNRVLSSKYLDDALEWYYYGYRYYSPELGRWPSRDPIGEKGDANLYGYIRNELMNSVDVLGLYSHQHGCNAEQLSVIAAAETTATTGASDGASLLASDYNNAAVLLDYPAAASHPPGFWLTFNSWYWGTKTTLNAINSGFTKNKYGVECECACKEGVVAYTRPGLIGIGLDDDIHFCPLFFSASAADQAQTFLHEASHMFAGTLDLALGGGTPWADNAKDAYWIQGFASGADATLDMFVQGLVLLWP